MNVFLVNHVLRYYVHLESKGLICPLNRNTQICTRFESNPKHASRTTLEIFKLNVDLGSFANKEHAKHMLGTSNVMSLGRKRIGAINLASYQCLLYTMDLDFFFKSR